MKLGRILTILLLMLAFSVSADAQGFIKNLGKKAVEKVKQKIENKVERETDEAMDDVLDGKKSDKKSSKQAKDADFEEANTDNDPQTSTSSDFKRGEVILFQDDITAETVGEFPSKWDLLDGNAEVKSLGGVKAIEVTNNGVITPLIKEEGAYLPEEFTIEYEFYYWTGGKDNIGLNDMKL
ncbi:MAG: hypothetical protein IJ726_03510, partial [Phocaeicola sp.]|nr:hypothetical protein [Phocaeicola sp.]